MVPGDLAGWPSATLTWRLLTMAKVTCPLQDLPIISPYLGRRYSESEQWRAEVLNRLRAERPKLVILSMSRRYGADFGFTSYDPAWVQHLADLVSELRTTTGARVLVLGPVPDPDANFPDCLSAHLGDPLACAPERAMGLNGLVRPDAGPGAGGDRRAGDGAAQLKPLLASALWQIWSFMTWLIGSR